MPLRTDLLEPIEGSNPAGEDLTYELILDELQEARREDLDVEQGDWERPLKRADHGLAIKLASDILAKRSKDLTVAAWLSESLLWQDGFAGLASGITLMKDLLDNFWDHVYPELEDDDVELRVGPLNWLGSNKLDIPIKRQALNKSGHDFFQYAESRLIPTEETAASDMEAGERRREALEDGKLPPEEFIRGFNATPKDWYKGLMADLNACLGAIDELDQFGREKFGDYDAPSYVSLRRVLEEFRTVGQSLLDEKLVHDPDPIEAEPIPTGDDGSGLAGSSSAGAGSAGSSGGGLSLEPVNEADAASRIATAARFLRRADPTNPGPYLLLRGYRWGELRAGGGELDPKLLDAPPTATRKHLKGLLLDGKWEDLLDAAEQVMGTPHGRGWLDLQRYVLTACDNLGSDYDQVSAAIATELRSLLADLPDLPELTLMDDAPTANRQTQAWLREQVVGDGDGEIPARAARPTASAASHNVVLERALAKVRAGEPNQGIALLMRHAEQEKSERARFLSRSEAAAIMLEHRLKAVALPILREMFEQINTHNLEGWESGEVVARPLGLLYQCLSSDEYELQQDLYERICRLDPIQAMSFDPNGGAEASSEDSSWGTAEEQDSGWNTGEAADESGWNTGG